MDKIDFNYITEQINRPIPVTNIQQDILADSSNINTTFKTIESSLNVLYENTRYLEDSINYCEAMLKERILECSNEISDTLKSIEDIRDLNKNMAYMEYQCLFKDDLSIKKDRNNSAISNMLIKNNVLTFGLDSDNLIPFSNISMLSEQVPYYNNLTPSSNGYRSFYIENEAISKGITESITITLKEPTEVNYIDLNVANAEIENFRLVYLNGLEERFDYSTTNGIFSNSIITQIKFDITCKKYTSTEYDLDKTKLTEDVWTKIKELEANYLSNNLSKLEIEALISRTSNDTTTYYNDEYIASNIESRKMYNYVFGIESIYIKKVVQSKDSSFISIPVDIKGLKDNEFIEIYVSDFINENATVEYSILDGNNEISVLPHGLKTVRNEKIFSSLPLRFNQDASLVSTIKKDGIVTDISLDDAKNQVLSRFSIDYYPALIYAYKPINSTIKIKAVIRKFTEETNDSYIHSIKIRKHGGDAVWME